MGCLPLHMDLQVNVRIQKIVLCINIIPSSNANGALQDPEHFLPHLSNVVPLAPKAGSVNAVKIECLTADAGAVSSKPSLVNNLCGD